MRDPAPTLPYLLPALVLAALALGGCPVVPTGSRVQVRVEAEERARAVAAAIAPGLATLVEDFEGRRQAMAGDPEEAERRIGQTEDELLALLEAPELAPLRDLVRHRLEGALEELRDLRAEARSSGTPDFRLTAVSVSGGAAASFGGTPARRTGEEAGPEASTLGLVVNRVLELLRTLRSRAEQNQLLVDVCFVSRPEGAAATLYRGADPEEVETTSTPGVIPYVWRGRYSYRVELPGHRTAECSLPCGIGLLHPRRPVLDCDLDPRAGDDSGGSPCELLDRREPRCEG